jgi:hypothetical protein
MTKTDAVEGRTDLPKIVGTIGARAPGAVIRIGLSYLRHKKGTQRAVRTFVRTLEENGVPEGLARDLGEAYGSDLSVRKIIGNDDMPPFIGKFIP